MSAGAALAGLLATAASLALAPILALAPSLALASGSQRAPGLHQPALPLRADGARPGGLKPSGLSEKESFMLLFGKGNGAMRVLCALQRDGLIDAATRRRYADRLEQLLVEAGDKAIDRRHLRIGMAFADARPSLCPERLLQAPGRDG